SRIERQRIAVVDLQLVAASLGAAAPMSMWSLSDSSKNDEDPLRQFLLLVRDREAHLLHVLDTDFYDDSLWEKYYQELRERGFASLPHLRTLEFRTADRAAQDSHAKALASVPRLPSSLQGRWIGLLDSVLDRHLHFLECCLDAAENRSLLKSWDVVQV